MYGYAREKSLNTVRSLMLKKMVGQDVRLTAKSKVDLSRLLPCRDNLVPHMQRVNHRLGLTLKKKQTRNLTLARSSTVMRMIEARLLQNHFM